MGFVGFLDEKARLGSLGAHCETHPGSAGHTGLKVRVCGNITRAMQSSLFDRPLRSKEYYEEFDRTEFFVYFLMYISNHNNGNASIRKY